MTEAEIRSLVEAAKVAGVPLSKVVPRNAFTMKGGVAESIQMGLEAVDPRLAARWRMEANGEAQTLEAVAAKAGIVEMTASAHTNLLQTDPDYIAGVEEAQARRESEILERMEKEAERLAAVSRARVQNGPSEEERMIIEDQRRAMREQLAARAGLYR